jgi:hypothetical protein
VRWGSSGRHMLKLNLNECFPPMRRSSLASMNRSKSAPRRGMKAVAQGLPWETAPPKMRPESGAGNAARPQAFFLPERSILAPLQHLQPGGPGVFPTRRYEVTPCEGAPQKNNKPRVNPG